eukprot:TRINITY_DN17396_c0_g1_i1.p1 TRINITY_DN17396_c0_g1~~TRINITY_DN17396_c0_g1_i1.p1  ORF type:complete len:672 (+),score=133.60 TRINITY_DN17396_c0_g1_i1:118-2133(+)
MASGLDRHPRHGYLEECAGLRKSLAESDTTDFEEDNVRLPGPARSSAERASSFRPAAREPMLPSSFHVSESRSLARQLARVPRAAGVSRTRSVEQVCGMLRMSESRDVSPEGSVASSSSGEDPTSMLGRPGGRSLRQQGLPWARASVIEDVQKTQTGSSAAFLDSQEKALERRLFRAYLRSTMAPKRDMQNEEDSQLKEDVATEYQKRRFRVFLILEKPGAFSRGATLGFLVQVLLVFFSCASIVISSLPEVSQEASPDFALFWGRVDTAFAVYFVSLYLLRMWATYHRGYLDFILQPLNLMDLLACISYTVPCSGMQDSALMKVVYCFRLTQVLQIFRLADFSAHLRVIVAAMQNSVDSLIVLAFCMAIVVFVFATIIWTFERGVWDTRRGCFVRDDDDDCSNFQSVVESSYWAVATMTTVGYGDVTAKSNAGKVVACLTMAVGVVVIAGSTSVLGMHFKDSFDQVMHEEEGGEEFLPRPAEGHRSFARRRHSALFHRQALAAPQRQADAHKVFLELCQAQQLLEVLLPRAQACILERLRVDKAPTATASGTEAFTESLQQMMLSSLAQLRRLLEEHVPQRRGCGPEGSANARAELEPIPLSAAGVTIELPAMRSNGLSTLLEDGQRDEMEGWWRAALLRPCNLDDTPLAESRRVTISLLGHRIISDPDR